MVFVKVFISWFDTVKNDTLEKVINILLIVLVSIAILKTMNVGKYFKPNGILNKILRFIKPYKAVDIANDPMLHGQEIVQSVQSVVALKNKMKGGCKKMIELVKKFSKLSRPLQIAIALALVALLAGLVFFPAETALLIPYAEELAFGLGLSEFAVLLPKLDKEIRIDAPKIKANIKRIGELKVQIANLENEYADAIREHQRIATVNGYLADQALVNRYNNFNLLAKPMKAEIDSLEKANAELRKFG